MFNHSYNFLDISEAKMVAIFFKMAAGMAAIFWIWNKVNLLKRDNIINVDAILFFCKHKEFIPANNELSRKTDGSYQL